MSENDVKVVKPALNPTALTVENAAKLLQLPAETIHRHVEQGAPVTADGAINLVHYAAWLNQQLSKVNS